jgi:putative endonuclease
MNNKELGLKGELKAAEYLSGLGMKILKQNYRTSGGEIDIIAEKEGVLRIVEVKSWKKYGFDSLEYAVGPLKQNKIIQTYKKFVAENRCFENADASFDVLFIDGSNNIRFIENAIME